MTMKKYKFLFVCVIVTSLIVLFLGHNSLVQQLLLTFGAKLKGEILRDPSKWIELIKKCSYVFVIIMVSIGYFFWSCLSGMTLFVVKPLYIMKDFKKYCSDFVGYIRNNIPLMILASLVVLIIYGIKLGEQVVGIDTEFWLQKQQVNWLEIGRFSLVFLQKIMLLFGQNLYVTNLFTILFLVLGTISWCYLLHSISEWKNKFSYVAFSLLYCSSPIFVEHFYFTLQAMEVSFVMALVPHLVYYTLYGLVNDNKKNLVLGCFILAFIIGMYQSLVVVFFCGFMMCCILLLLSESLPKRDEQGLFLKGLFYIVIAIIIYFLMNKLVQVIFEVKPTEYLKDMYTLSLKSIVLAIPKYCYRLLLFLPLEFFLVCLFLPFYFFCLFTQYHIRTKILLFVIVLSIFAFPLVTGGETSFRVQLMEPVVMGFVAFMVFGRLGKGKQIFKGIFLVICVFQIQDSSLVNYTDYIRYQQDKMVAQNIHSELQRTGCDDLPVILYGNFSPKYMISHKIGEVSGHSFFEWDKGFSPLDSTGRGLQFMKVMGFHYQTTQDEALIQKARIAAESMVDYPSPGFVQNLGDVVVVRLSESTYIPD